MFNHNYMIWILSWYNRVLLLCRHPQKWSTDEGDSIWLLTTGSNRWQVWLFNIHIVHMTSLPSCWLWGFLQVSLNTFRWNTWCSSFMRRFLTNSTLIGQWQFSCCVFEHWTHSSLHNVEKGFFCSVSWRICLHCYYFPSLLTNHIGSGLIILNCTKLFWVD